MTHTGETIPHARRRQDRQKSGQLRNLEWGSLSSDVELFDQSPVLLTDALATSGSVLNLTPVAQQGLDDTHAATDADTLENITSIQALKSRKSETSQNNLLTRHDTSGLRERCKQLQMQHALVKKRGEQQLYLAVGMLHWPRGSESGETAVSPLLFYPMQLISAENSQSESGYVYSIRNQSEHPEFNYQLTSELRRHYGITLPVYKTSESLVEFLRQIELCVASEEAIRLELTVGLGMAKSPAGISATKDSDGSMIVQLPKDFDASLAGNLMQGQDIEGLRSTLRLLKASNERDLIDEDAPTELPSTPDINEVHEFSLILDQHGLGKIRFQDLPDLPEQIREWIDDVEPQLRSELVTSCLQQDSIGAVPLLKIAGVVELLDKAPLNIESFLHADLAYRGTPLLFKRAKYQARLIEQEMEQLEVHFHLDRVPSQHQLLQLLDELSGVDNNAFEVVDSDYFHARRRFMELSIEKPTTLTDFHRRQLNKLVKVLRFRELFVNNSEYRMALGPAYRGLKTDWDSLEAVLTYAQQISTFLNSESIAAHILGDWRRFNNMFNNELDQLQATGRGLHHLLKIDTPLNTEISVQELLEHGRVLATKLQEWNLEYGLITNYGDKTPATLLSIFSGKTQQDKKTEEQVRDANHELQQYLLKNQDSSALKRINATLGWLNETVNDSNATVAMVEEIVAAAAADVKSGLV